MPMNCKSVQNRISAFLDRELSHEDSASVRAHIQDCNNCRSELEAIATLKDLLHRTPVPEPDAYFEERLIGNVMKRIESPTSPRKVLLFRPVLAFCGVVVLSMMVTLVGLNVLQRTEDARASLKQKESEIAFDIQRDQVYTMGTDAFGGMPVIHVTPESNR
jgi:predicted anti-sigma-YlaC factor YlaD